MKPFFRYLDTVGDGSGTKAVTGDYSATAQIFKMTIPPGYIYYVHRLIAFVQDAGAWRSEYYAGLGGPLTNGFLVGVFGNDDVIVDDLTDGIPIDSIGSWKRVCYDVDVLTLGAGDTTGAVRWTIERAGSPVSIDGDDGRYFGILANDDFTGLVDHTFMVQGSFQKKPFA